MPNGLFRHVAVPPAGLAGVLGPVRIGFGPILAGTVAVVAARRGRTS